MRRFIVLFAIIAFGSGCMSAMVSSGVQSGVESTAVGGQFLLHDNPKVGDYAVYKTITRASQTSMGMQIDIKSQYTNRYEITSMNDTGITVKVTSVGDSVDTLVNGQPSKSMTREEIAKNNGTPVMEYNLDKKGNIIGVTYKNEKLGIDTKFKKAEPGGEGFIQYTPVNQSIELKTDAGSFKCNTLTYTTKTSSNVSAGIMKANAQGINQNITYTNPSVKFAKVASITTFVVDANAVIEYGKVAKTITAALTLTKFAMNPALIMSDAKSLFDFAKNNVLPGKEDVLNSILKDQELTLKGMQGSTVEYLVEQGRK